MQVQSIPQASKFPAAAFGLRPPAASRMPAGTQLVLGKGEELFAEGDEAEFFYQVVSGTIRSYKLLSDGRRQIDAFHLQGDIFGLEAGSEHRFSAEAVGKVTVIAYRRSRLAALIHDDPAFSDKIMTATLRSLERAQDHMMLLGRKTAREKVATFLLDMAERISGDVCQLRPAMQRSDIADHLGLTIRDRLADPHPVRPQRADQAAALQPVHRPVRQDGPARPQFLIRSPNQGGCHERCRAPRPSRCSRLFDVFGWNAAMLSAVDDGLRAGMEVWIACQQEAARFSSARWEEDRHACNAVLSALSAHDVMAIAKVQEAWRAKTAADYVDEACRLQRLLTCVPPTGVTPAMAETAKLVA